MSNSFLDLNGLAHYKEKSDSALNTALADYTTTANLTTLLAAKEDKANKVTSISSSSTDSQYPSAKAVYGFGVSSKNPVAITDPTNAYYTKAQTDTLLATKENPANKVSDISANRESTEKYPNAKAVYDAYFKRGVVSQTQTWTQAADGGYDYVMSDLVYGDIPKSNIDLYEAAGAVFNATSGYFELNGLTDISYEEMRKIYAVSAGATFGLKDCKGFYAFVDTRSVLPIYVSSMEAFTRNFNAAFYGSGQEDDKTGIEGLKISSKSNTNDTSVYIDGSVGFTNTFNGCRKLRKIDGIFNLGSAKIAPTTTFGGCRSLEEVRIKRLTSSISFSVSPRLSIASIVYMVANANNTSAITITLHATAYARCQADTTEYTYGGQTYTGILAYASAKNITIASA